MRKDHCSGQTRLLGARCCINMLLLLFSLSAVSDSLRPHGLQHPRLPCPLSPGACSNSSPLSRWCHPTILSSVTSFSFCLQSFPASGSFTMNQFFAPGDQSIEASVSASVFPMNIQGGTCVHFRTNAACFRACLSAALPAAHRSYWNCLLGWQPPGEGLVEPLPHHTRKDVLQEDEVEILLHFQITETFS